MPARDGMQPAIRRLDYRPPAFLVDRSTSSSTSTRRRRASRRRSTFRRNPPRTRRRDAALVLDGEDQRDVAVALDGAALPASAYTRDAHALTVLDPPARGSLTVRSTINPAAQRRARGPLRVVGRVLHAVRSRRLPADHVFSRPARRARDLHGDDRRRPRALPGAAVERQSRRAPGALDRRPAFRDAGTTRFRSRRTCSRWSRATSPRSRTRSRRCPAARSHSRSGRRRATCRAAAHAMAALKRAMRWDEERFGREYDLDRFMIFCADDFNMGAMENKGLNIFNSRLVLADPETATDDDYQAIEGVIGHEYFHNWTGNRVTCRDWFQLSLKEGLTVFRDQEFSSRHAARAPSSASPRSTTCAARSSPRTRARWRTRCGPTSTSRSTTSTRRPSTRRAPRSSGCSTRCSAPSASGAAWTSTSSATTARRSPATTSCRRWRTHSRRRPRARAVPALVQPGRHAGGARCADATTPPRRTYTLDIAQHTAPTPGQPDKEPFHIPLAVGLVDPDGARPPAAPRRREPGPRARRACSRSLRERAGIRVHRRAGGAGAVAPARLLGAGAARVRLHRRRARVPRRARQRCRQPLGRRAAQLLQRHPRARARAGATASRARCRRRSRAWRRHASPTTPPIRRCSRWR